MYLSAALGVPGATLAENAGRGGRHGRAACRAAAGQRPERLGDRKIFGYRSPQPVLDTARAFIVAKLGHQRYEALARQRGMGSVRIARTLGKEALEKD